MSNILTYLSGKPEVFIAELACLMRECKGHRDYVFAEGGHERELLDIPIDPQEHAPHISGYRIKASLRNIMPDSMRKAKMIRTKRHKLVYRINDRCELYDLVEDPMELNNLYAEVECSDVRKELEQTLLRHLIETEQNLPFDPLPIA